MTIFRTTHIQQYIHGDEEMYRLNYYNSEEDMLYENSMNLLS